MSNAASDYASTISWRDIAQRTMVLMNSVLRIAAPDSCTQPFAAP
jgi:hypothetical protein